MSRHDDWATHLDPDLEGAEVTDDERAALDRIKGRLADDALWDGPSAGVFDRVLAELDGNRLDGDEADTQPAIQRPAEQTGRVVSLDEARDRRVSGRPRWLVPAAAIAAVAAVIVLVAFPRSTGETFTVAGTDLAPEATATVVVEELPSGFAITIEVEGLPPAEPGMYYTAWLNSPETAVPIGTFHMRGGSVPIELWSGVDPADYPVLGITLQTEGESPLSSGIAYMRGRVAP